MPLKQGAKPSSGGKTTDGGFSYRRSSISGNRYHGKSKRKLGNHEAKQVPNNNIMERISDMILDALKLEKLSIQEFTSARIAIEKVILNEAFDKIDQEDI